MLASSNSKGTFLVLILGLSLLFLAQCRADDPLAVYNPLTHAVTVLDRTPHTIRCHGSKSGFLELSSDTWALSSDPAAPAFSSFLDGAVPATLRSIVVQGENEFVLDDFSTAGALSIEAADATVRGRLQVESLRIQCRHRLEVTAEATIYARSGVDGGEIRLTAPTLICG